MMSAADRQRKHRLKNKKKGVKRVYSEEQKIRNRAHSMKWKRKNPVRTKQLTAAWRKTDRGVIGRLLNGAKKRAKETGRECSIAAADIFIPPLCPLLCIPIIVGRGKQGPNSPSVDRIDSSKGYIPGNVWIISQKANRVKSDATPEEIMLLARNLDLLVKLRGGDNGI